MSSYKGSFSQREAKDKKKKILRSSIPRLQTQVMPKKRTTKALIKDEDNFLVPTTLPLIRSAKEAKIVPEEWAVSARRWRGRVRAYATLDDFDLEKVNAFFLDCNMECVQYRGSVIHVPYSIERGLPRKDLFLFYYGVVIFWGMTEIEEQGIMNELEPFAKRKLDEEEQETDIFSYSFGQSTTVTNNEWTIDEEDHVFIKFSISHGIAQSTKLGVFENRVHLLIENTRHLPEELATTGRIKLSHKDVHRLMGQLFINYSSMYTRRDILNLPDFFWEYEQYEKYYRLAWTYLDVDQRITVMEQKLDIIEEFLDLLSDELETSKMVRLTWIILVLLSVEIVIVITKEVLVKLNYAG